MLVLIRLKGLCAVTNDIQQSINNLDNNTLNTKNSRILLNNIIERISYRSRQTAKIKQEITTVVNDLNRLDILQDEPLILKRELNNSFNVVHNTYWDLLEKLKLTDYIHE